VHERDIADAGGIGPPDPESVLHPPVQPIRDLVGSEAGKVHVADELVLGRTPFV
jgi:hypothetical protein